MKTLFKKAYAFLQMRHKYQWYPYIPNNPALWGIAGFDFLDPILMNQQKLIQFTRINGILCAVFQAQTSSSIYWKEGDPVNPIYFAEGLCAGNLIVFYDNKTVHPFWEYILNKPRGKKDLDADDILRSLYEIPEDYV